MKPFDLLAERKIEAAVSRGDLDGLPGAGRPLLERFGRNPARAALAIEKNRIQ